MRKLFFKGFTIAALLWTSAAVAQQYRPIVLNEIKQRVADITNQGKKAVVLFDLDDTLIMTRERNLRILRDFASNEIINKNYPREAVTMGAMTIFQVRYQLTDTLKDAGITSEELIKKANDFWLPNFFSNEYCADDLQTPGAAGYLYDLVKAGAQIVFLTGRDIPRMQKGTVENLKKNRFPSSAKLIMKPDPKMDDLQFKKSAFAEVSQMGEVVGVFENEPANLNAMSDAFPKATAVFLDTVHSSKPDVPYANASWVPDFTGPYAD